MRLELSDLPPWARAQAEKQLANAEGRGGKSAIEVAAKAASKTGKEFDSRGEYEFYMGAVVPGMAAGKIVKCERHPCFNLFPAGEYDGIKLRPIRYTADFRLDYADGSVEIVEIKSKFVRRMQRDYPVRRRVFLEKIRPLGWKFREVITTDSKEDVEQWKRLAKQNAGQ